MIKITKNKKNVLFHFENQYNKKAQQIIELLAIQYFAIRRYSRCITNIEYEFENERFFDDLFLTTIIGNLLDTGLNITSYDNNSIQLENVS